MITHEEWVAAKDDLAEPGDLLPEGWTWVPWQEEHPISHVFPRYVCAIWVGPVMQEGSVVAYSTVEAWEVECTTPAQRMQMTRHKLQIAILSARDVVAGKSTRRFGPWVCG